MMAMTTRPELRSLLLLLLTANSLVSTRHLLESSQNISTSNPTLQHGGGTTPQTDPEILHTKDPSQTSPEGHDIAPTTAQNSPVMGTKRSETSGYLHPSTGNERPSSTAGTESPAGSEISLRTLLPVRNGTTGPTSSPGRSSPRAVRSSSSSSTSPLETSFPTTSILVAPKMITPDHITDSAVTVATTPKATVGGSLGTQAMGTTGRAKGHVCSTAAPRKDNLVGRCLIAIASVTALATIFIVTTIVLATKLSSSRYRHRARLLEELDTEMVCISRVVSGDCVDRPVPKPRRPRSNGALIPNTEDEDGDDLTLNSFLPDTECAA